MRRAVAGFLLASLVFVGVACGDDDDSGGTAAGLTEAAFVEQATAVCTDAMGQFFTLLEEEFPATPDKMVPFFEKATVIYRGQIDGLRAIGSPEGAVAADVTELLALGDKVVADLDRASDDQEFASELFGQEGGSNLEAFDEKATAMGLEACVEGGDGAEDEGPALLDPATFSAEKRAFVEQADAACAAVREQETALEEQHLATWPPPLESWAEFMPAVVELQRGLIAELRALAVPAGDEAAVEAALARQEAVLADIEAAGELAASGDQAAFDPALEAIFPQFDEVEQVFAAYGFQVCGIESTD